MPSTFIPATGHVLDASTLALWRLNDPSGATSLSDDTGTYPLVTLAGPPPVVAGQIGNARAVTTGQAASSASVAANDPAIAVLQSGTFTAEGWFWIDPSISYPATWNSGGTGNNHGAIFGLAGAGNGSEFFFGLDSTGFFIYSISNGFTSGGSWSGLAKGTWHHLAVRCTSSDATHSTADFFLDGVKIGTATILKYALTPSAVSAWNLGGESSGFNNFTGRIDDCRFSKVARADADIFDSYRRGFPIVGLATYDPNHATEALAKLALQYQGRPLLAGLIGAFTTQLQAIEDALAAPMTGVFPQRQLANAVGHQLDVLGSIVGQPRNGQVDATYLQYIKARVALNVSSGTVEDIYNVFLKIIAAGQTLSIQEWFPAAFSLRVFGVPLTNPSDFLALLKAAKAAGVRAFVEYSGGSPQFQYDGPAGTGYDNGAYAGAIS